MYKYEKPIAELIEVRTADSIMWEAGDESLVDLEDWEEMED